MGGLISDLLNLNFKSSGSWDVPQNSSWDLKDCEEFCTACEQYEAISCYYTTTVQ